MSLGFNGVTVWLEPVTTQAMLEAKNTKESSNKFWLIVAATVGIAFLLFMRRG